MERQTYVVDWHWAKGLLKISGYQVILTIIIIIISSSRYRQRHHIIIIIIYTQAYPSSETLSTVRKQSADSELLITGLLRCMKNK